VIRFAVIITAVELALTLGALLFVTLAETRDPYLDTEDFEGLGIPVEKHSTDPRMRFGALFSYDTQAVAKGPGPAITISVRVNTPREEFEAREAAERSYRTREGEERPVVNDESWPGEPAYAVRHRGRNGVRSELVRLRGREMLIVRVIRMNPTDMPPGVTASTCEHLARLVQGAMVRKLGWREDPRGP